MQKLTSQHYRLFFFKNYLPVHCKSRWYKSYLTYQSTVNHAGTNPTLHFAYFLHYMAKIAKNDISCTYKQSHTLATDSNSKAHS